MHSNVDDISERYFSLTNKIEQYERMYFGLFYDATCGIRHVEHVESKDFGKIRYSIYKYIRDTSILYE